jgi:hypothetical protein
MASPVTDPAILALLDQPEEKKALPVTDPAILAQLEGGSEQKTKVKHKASLQDIDDFVRSAANGATFGLADRFAAKMSDLTGIGGKSGDYAGNLANEQQKTAAISQDNPGASVGGHIAGGAATLPLLPLKAVTGASLGAKTLYGALLGAGLGGAQGAGGTKDFTDLPQLGRDTLFGAGTGAALGGAVPLVAGGVGAAYNGVMNAMRGGADGISRGASRHLIEALRADGAPAVQSKMGQLGPDAMLADAGPAFLGKAQGASLNSDEGRSALATALTSRNEGTNARIMGDVNKALGPAEDPQTVTNAIRARRSEVDSKAYPAALDNAPEVKTSHILTSLDDAIENSVGMEKKALTNLKGMLTKTERKPLVDSEGYPQYDKLGNERFQETSVSQNDANVLHKVKGELDNVIQYDAPGLGVPAGALTRQQAALKSFRHDLNRTLEEQVPGYANANRESAALAKRGEAVEAGTQYLGSGKTTPSPERFANEFDPLSQGEKIAFAKGSRGNIERVLGTKSNDLQALRGELQGEGGWNTSKIATVHGQDAADELMGSVERNLKFRDTHNKVVENSQTAQRTAAAKAMKPDPSSETPLLNPNMTLTGMAATVGKKAVSATIDALLRRDPTAAYGEVAKVLSAQGPQRDAHLAALIEALSRRQANAEIGPVVGNRAALAAALVGNGFARRSSEPQDNRQ